MNNLIDMEIKTFTTVDREGTIVCLFLAVWNGHVLQADVYRNSDMTELERHSFRGIK